MNLSACMNYLPLFLTCVGIYCLRHSKTSESKKVRLLLEHLKENISHRDELDDVLGCWRSTPKVQGLWSTEIKEFTEDEL